MQRLVPANGGSTPEPDGENVSRGVYVAIVSGSTVHAIPLPYSELSYSLGAG